jgi:N-6 DNA Methylase
MSSNSIQELLSAVVTATQAAKNEAQLRHEIEKALERTCLSNSIPWTPFQLERALRSQSKSTKFADVAHGAVVIEYEPPNSFASQVNAKALHAREQVEEYAQLISLEEGRNLQDYILVIWDGGSINFGRFLDTKPQWETLTKFDFLAANRLIEILKNDGKPLVHPRLLEALVGPDSEYGQELIPLLYKAIVAADSSEDTGKTKLLYSEWRRLFSQVVGFQPASMKKLLARQQLSHGQPYEANPAAYLFALNTYVAIVTKFVAAASIAKASQDVLDASVSLLSRLEAIESGDLFVSAGVSNMLAGDFFSWYVDDAHWSHYAKALEGLIGRLSGIDFEITKKNLDSTRDLFKGLYEQFIPREVRHALGEFYTPDWLAEHAINLLNWQVSDNLLDPTCGSGTFLLEAVRRRLVTLKGKVTVDALLDGIYGIDLNPLAVLAAKGSLVVFISPYLNPAVPTRLPIYLADTINPAEEDEHGLFTHKLDTEMGPKQFTVPARLIRNTDFFNVFARIRVLVDAGVTSQVILDTISKDYHQTALTVDEFTTLKLTVQSLVQLHAEGWNGIWCAILADRFAAGAIPRVKYICGNPPWVKWSNLPTEYAKANQDNCRALGVFSTDKWVGGIEADISTVVTFSAIQKYLAPNGRLGFFLPESVFTTESAAGFRSFSVGIGRLQCKVLFVESFAEIKPFDGVSNKPIFLALERDGATQYPIKYSKWSFRAGAMPKNRRLNNVAQFEVVAQKEELLALPVPGGSNTRPWLVGTKDEQLLYTKVFAAGERQFQARKGVTTDRNGIFWVRVLNRLSSAVSEIRNEANIGKTKGIPALSANIESEHLFPLLRGRGVKSFRAMTDPDLCLLMPQREMNGDKNLPISAPLTFKFLSRFKAILEQRSSLKRYQKKEVFYSLWSTGAYTFSPFKVVWREIGNGENFAVAYIGSAAVHSLDNKIILPDHKLYFIPVNTEDEAAYLTAYLNAPIISRAVASYGAQLSLGVSVAEYLSIPAYDPSLSTHTHLSSTAKLITHRGDGPTNDELNSLDATVLIMLDLTELNAKGDDALRGRFAGRAKKPVIVAEMDVAIAAGAAGRMR